MLFNSYSFLFTFLPITLIIYFFAFTFIGGKAGKLILLISSLFFYGSNNINYLIIFLISILINFLLSKAFYFKSTNKKYKNILLSTGIFLNLFLLFIFKYYNFFVDNLSGIYSNFPNIDLLLPIGISFYTFQQIGFLIDIHKKEIKDYDFIDYSLFVSFFPQLIAGPIVKFSDFIKQIKSKGSSYLSIDYYSTGLIIFIFGLFKKIVIADFLSRNVQFFYDAISYGSEPSILTSWLSTISYSLQIYFDFSAYSEMAIGLGLFFGLRLPINFDSPYKSKSLIEYWNRWNITLSHFFRDNLYTPIFLALSKRTSLSFSNHIYSIILSMTILGFWHGANWNCIIFGLMHGIGLAINHIFKSRRIASNIYPIVKRILLLAFVNISFVFFKSKDLFIAKTVIYSLLPINQLTNFSSWNIASDISFPSISRILIVLILLAAVIFMPSNLEITGYISSQINSSPIISPFKKYNLNKISTIFTSFIISLIFIFCIQSLYIEQAFVYFQF